MFKFIALLACLFFKVWAASLEGSSFQKCNFENHCKAKCIDEIIPEQAIACFYAENTDSIFYQSPSNFLYFPEQKFDPINIEVQNDNRMSFFTIMTPGIYQILWSYTCESNNNNTVITSLFNLTSQKSLRPFPLDSQSMPGSPFKTTVSGSICNEFKIGDVIGLIIGIRNPQIGLTVFERNITILKISD